MDQRDRRERVDSARNTLLSSDINNEQVYQHDAKRPTVMCSHGTADRLTAMKSQDTAHRRTRLRLC